MDQLTENAVVGGVVAPGPALRRLTAGMFTEPRLIWELTAKDLPASVGIGIAWSVVAWHAASGALSALPLIVLKSALYFLAYVLPHCIANQITGVAEDRVNKPWRLVPSGRLSLRQMWARWFVYVALFLTIAAVLGVLPWALAWLFVLANYNFGSATDRWYMKDLWMGLGMVTLMAAAWQLVAPLDGASWRWIATLSLFVFLLVPMQDLRDIEGDRTRGRRTFPLAFGELACRRFLSLCFLAMPVLFFFMLRGARSPLGAAIAGLVIGAWAWGLGWRVWFRRDPRADHDTYQAFCWWFVAWEASAFFVL